MSPSVRQPEYARFTQRQVMEKSLHTLEGLLHGLLLDERISADEARTLLQWCREHDDARSYHPFDEIVEVLEAILKNGSANADQVADVTWLARQMQSGNQYFDALTSDIQRLHGILQGLLADGVVDDQEVRALQRWLEANTQLRGCYPYDQLVDLIGRIIADGRISEAERSRLREFLLDFCESPIPAKLGEPSRESMVATNLCAVNPHVAFPDRSFCFTGELTGIPREAAESAVVRLGGRVRSNVSRQLDYLVLGLRGNPCWAFSCYGRKVEQAIALQKDAGRPLIVHENDFVQACKKRGARVLEHS